MLAVYHHDKARFFAVEELFDNNAMTRVAKSVARQHIVNSRFGFFQRHRHDNAFPGSQTVRFNDDWRAFLTQIRQRRFYLGEVLVFRRRDLMAGQEILGKRFRAFQLRGTCGWAEDFQPGGAEGINHAFHQRRFRADDGQIDLFVLREIQQRRDIGYADSDVLQCGFQRSACITRSNKNSFNQRRLGRFPGQRVLAPAVTNH